jgi:hypothetical protein
MSSHVQSSVAQEIAAGINEATRLDDFVTEQLRGPDCSVESIHAFVRERVVSRQLGSARKSHYWAR